ncbi:MAG: BON domain-containing protein [Chloroflexi bacterium]|nr:BON domain-containing protein [Chloroflexota bacterium]
MVAEQAVLEEQVLTDEELQEQVYHMLNHVYPPFRELLLPIEVEVKDGVVTLTGWVRTSTMKHMATKLAAEVPGVKEVHNCLVADDELERAVAAALEAEPSLEDDFPGIHVDALAGAITLWGYVSSEEDKRRAEEIAAQVDGVRKVINDLKVREPMN